MKVSSAGQSVAKELQSSARPEVTAASAVSAIATSIWRRVIRPLATARVGPTRSALSAPETASP